MLATIREYATERLDDDPELAAPRAARTPQYFADFARRQRERMTADSASAALDRAGRRASRTCAGVAPLGARAATSASSRSWSTPCGCCTTLAAGTTARSSSRRSCWTCSPPARHARARAQEITLRTSLARALMALRGYTDEVEEEYRPALELFEGAGEVPAAVSGAAQPRRHARVPRRVRQGVDVRPPDPASSPSRRATSAAGGRAPHVGAGPGVQR